MTSTSTDWQSLIEQVKTRFDQEYSGKSFDLPPEVESMPLFQEWINKSLQAKITSPFWEIAQFHKNQRCLDIGCGVSFLIYPWRDWDVFFYGQEISSVARDALNSRGSQLNSKLFKAVELGAAHQLRYADAMFDCVIATGFSCYFPPAYWQDVILEAKRVLKPDGIFIFDAIDPTKEIAENWAILETYLGTEVFLSPLQEFTNLIDQAKGKITATKLGELFCMYRVKF